MATARVTLLACASTPAVRAGRFPRDEHLDVYGRSALTGVRLDRTYDAAWYAPSRRGFETAEVLDVVGTPESALAPWNLGAFTGLDPDEVPVSHFGSWRTNPDWAGHGGESLTALMKRTAAWLANLEPRRCLAIADAAVIRAAVASVLPGDWRLFWAIEVAPAGVVELRRNATGWALTGLR